MTKPQETLSDLRQQKADVKRRLEEVGRTLATLQAELAMVDYHIANHRDYVPQIQRPVLYDPKDFFNGVYMTPKGTVKKKKVINLDGLDLEDLDI